MRFLLVLLAIAGVLAVVRGLFRAMLRLVRHSLEGFVLREIGRSRAQQGDLTRLMEAGESTRVQRAVRLRGMANVAAWLALLLVPIPTSYTLPIYAAYALLWLLPLRQGLAVQRTQS